MEPVDPSLLRVSDQDRHKVAEVLRQAAGEGRLEIEELEERLEATYAAKTYADLAPITLDLPTGERPQPPVVRPVATPAPRTPSGVEPTYASSLAVLSETKRVGVWDVGEVHTATAFMGSVVIDLREARFPGQEVVISACAVMGSVEILVNPVTVVRMEGTGIMGNFAETRPKVAARLDAGSPVVRVRGLAFWGSVEVKRKAVPGEWRRKVLGRGDR